MAQHTTPCGECPFRRTVEPGALGGSEPEVYIGQAQGQFWLPCHMRQDCTTDEGRRDPSSPQCAGAAIYRANIGGVARPLLELPADPVVAFASAEEFLAHHRRLPLDEARERLRRTPPEALLRRELGRAGVQVSRVARG